MAKVLLLAAASSLFWGVCLAFFPSILFGWLGMSLPRFAVNWQWVGIALGVYSVGYTIAATSPLRHWLIVLVGLLGKLFGIAGFLMAAIKGTLPWAMGWMVVAHDVIWLVPFGLILRAAVQDFLAESGHEREARDRMMLKHMTQQGYSLYELSQIHPTLVVFLRHAGCTFCRQTLADLARQRKQLKAAGVQLAFVTMSNEPGAQEVFDAHGLGNAHRISDPSCELYRAFDLRRCGWADMLSPRVWWHGLKSAFWERHGVGFADGDVSRMPGVFLIRDGGVIRSYRHVSPADRPNYMELATSGECGVVRPPSA